MFLSILRVLGGDGTDKGVARIAIGEKGADGEKDLGDREGWRPFIFEYVQTYDSLRIDITVIDPCPEFYFGWLERVFGGEVYIQEEYASFINGARRT